MHHQYSCVVQIPVESTGAPFLVINQDGTKMIILMDLARKNIFQMIQLECEYIIFMYNDHQHEWKCKITNVPPYTISSRGHDTLSQILFLFWY